MCSRAFLLSIGVVLLAQPRLTLLGPATQLCFWFSVNMSFSALATGSLGAEYFT